MRDILLAIGVPLMAGLVLTLLRAVASGKQLSLESSRDVALDMTFLAVGAAGSVFNDSRVHSMLGENTMACLMGLIFFDLIVASVQLYMRRFFHTITRFRAFLHLSLATTALALVMGVIYAGARHHL